MLIPGCSIIPAASFSECRHGGLTGGLVAARRRAILINRDCSAIATAGPAGLLPDEHADLALM
jgi:hypothetical protein